MTEASSRRSEGFDGVRFVHEALPDLDLGKIDLGTDFLGRRLKAPLLIDGRGAEADAAVRLAEAAQHLGVGLVISQGPDMAVRLKAPDTPILAGIRAADLMSGFGVDQARAALDQVAADALVVELDPLRVAGDPEGMSDWWGLGGALEALAKGLDAPVAARGRLSPATARRLVEMGVAALDLASGEAVPDQPAFEGWGAPQATAITPVRSACPSTMLIASDLTDGVEAAKAIRLGADMAGLRTAVASAASTEAVFEALQQVVRELRMVCFCTDSANLTALRRAPLHA